MLVSFLGNFGAGCTSKTHERELRKLVSNVITDASKPCQMKHWWQQFCNKALALGSKRNVFVITSGNPIALKFNIRGEGPRSIPIEVSEMGPDSTGDALVCDNDIVLLYDGVNHYNGLVSSSVAEGLA